MRHLFLGLVLAPPTAVLLMSIALLFQLRHFQRVVPVLRTPDDVVKFKSLAKTQMFATLASFVLLVVPLLVWFFGCFGVAVLGWLDFPGYVVLPFVVVVVSIAAMPRTAQEVRNTPVANPSLEAERDHVADVWVNRLLPDW